MKYLLLVLLLGYSSLTVALPEYQLIIRDHLFVPEKLVVPAGRKFRLSIINYDEDPEKFESFELNREKVIFPGRRAFIYIGPLAPGRYPFVGIFHPHSARGELIVRATEADHAD